MDFKGWGPLIAVVAAPTVALLVGAGAFRPGPDGSGGLIYEYQTLIAGGAALLAAFLRWHVDRSADSQSERHFRRQLEIANEQRRIELDREVDNFARPLGRLVGALNRFLDE